MDPKIHAWEGRTTKREFEERLILQWKDLTASRMGEGLTCYYTRSPGSVMPDGQTLPRHVASWQGGLGWIFRNLD